MTGMRADEVEVGEAKMERAGGESREALCEEYRG